MIRSRYTVGDVIGALYPWFLVRLDGDPELASLATSAVLNEMLVRMKPGAGIEEEGSRRIVRWEGLDGGAPLRASA